MNEENQEVVQKWIVINEDNSYTFKFDDQLEKWKEAALIYHTNREERIEIIRDFLTRLSKVFFFSSLNFNFL